MSEIFDEYCWEEHKKVITYKKHQVQGLGNFAYWNLSRAIPPTPAHHHSDIIEIHCLIKGKRYVEINNTTHSITGNELFISYPYEVHSSGNLAQHPCSFYGCQIDLKYKDNLLGLNQEYSHALYELLTHLPSRHLVLSSNEVTLLKLSFKHFSHGNSASIKLGVQYLCSFLFNLTNLPPIQPKILTDIDPAIQLAIDFIEIHFKEPIHLKELAQISGYSLSHFKLKFKDAIGITPADFIMLRKFEFTKEQLEISDISITDLAFLAGFSSSNYFCTVFKKLANCSPSTYRKKFR